MDSRTKITLTWELHEQGVNNSQITKRLEVHRETVGLWLRGVREHGLLAFLDAYRQADKQPRPTRQVLLSTKPLVWQLRKREHGSAAARKSPTSSGKNTTSRCLCPRSTRYWLRNT